MHKYLLNLSLTFLLSTIVFETHASKFYFGLDLKQNTFEGNTITDADTGKTIQQINYINENSATAAEIKFGYLWNSNKRYQFGAEVSVGYMPKMSTNHLYIVPRQYLFQPLFHEIEIKETHRVFAVETNGMIDYKISKRFHTNLLCGFIYNNIKNTTYLDNQKLNNNVSNYINPKIGVALRYTIFNHYDFGFTYHLLIKKGTFDENSYASIGINYFFGNRKRNYKKPNVLSSASTLEYSPRV